MIYKIYILLLLFITFPLLSQDNNTKNLLYKQNYKIQKIILSNKDVLRGFDFGIDYLEVKTKEKGKLIGEGDNFLIYEIDLSHKEAVDILYYIDKNKKITGFGISIINNNRLYKEFSEYFDLRYGKYILNEKDFRQWTKDDDYIIEMSLSKDNISSIEIEYSKIKTTNYIIKDIL